MGRSTDIRTYKYNKIMLSTSASTSTSTSAVKRLIDPKYKYKCCLVTSTYKSTDSSTKIKLSKTEVLQCTSNTSENTSNTSENTSNTSVHFREHFKYFSALQIPQRALQILQSTSNTSDLIQVMNKGLIKVQVLLCVYFTLCP